MLMVARSLPDRGSLALPCTDAVTCWVPRSVWTISTGKVVREPGISSGVVHRRVVGPSATQPAGRSTASRPGGRVTTATPVASEGPSLATWISRSSS